jgi:hypothetical protein
LFRSRAVGLLAGIVMASWNFYGMRAVTGPEPKAFVILFAMLALTALAQKRWGWAGISAALSALAWQPALMVQAIVMLFALTVPWLETPRAVLAEHARAAWKNNLRALFGFAIPFALVLLYIAVNSALVAAFNATIGANVFHFNNNQARVPLLQTVDENLAEIIYDGSLYCFSYNEQWLLGAGALGLAGIVTAQIVNRARNKQSLLNLNVTPLLLYTAGFAAFTLIDFDFCPDLIPMFPALALGVGWLAVTLTRGIVAGVARLTNINAVPRARLMLLAFIAFLLVALYGLDAWGYQITGVSFLDQLQVAQTAEKYLKPQDRVLSFGNTIVQIELHRPSASKILHLGSKSGLGVLASEPGGFQGLLDELDRNPPDMIVLARETRPEWTAPFYMWLDKRYKQIEYSSRANMRILLLKK